MDSGRLTHTGGGCPDSPVPELMTMDAAPWETLIVQSYIARDEWGSGPWEEEPDLVVWRHRGIACVISRSPISGALCGYVEVPRAHPYHGRRHWSVRADVHGGLTYSGAGAGPGWWLGFDAAHGFDVAPKHEALMRSLVGEPPPGMENFMRYRPIRYMRGEVERLAAAVAMTLPAATRRRATKARTRAASAARQMLVHLAGARPSAFFAERGTIARTIRALQPAASLPRSLRS